MGASYGYDHFKDYKQGLAQLCRLSSYLDPIGLSIMYKSFVHSCLEYGHLLYFSAIWNVWMLFNVRLPVFVIAPFLPWNHIGMLQRLVSYVNY